MENNNFALMFGHLAVYLFVWVFAITAQAATTAWMSNRFGDDTAKNQGRITLSPFSQIDLIGTLILPAIGFIFGWMSGGILPLIAWGKGVPVDSSKWRDPKLAGVMVALAGTFTSIVIALISFLLLKFLFVSGIADAENFVQVILRRDMSAGVSWLAPFELIFWYGMVLNIVLAIFSLIPFPPFAGGSVLSVILPTSFKPLLDFFARYGIFIALLLIYFGAIGYVLSPILFLIVRLLGI